MGKGKPAVALTPRERIPKLYVKRVWNRDCRVPDTFSARTLTAPAGRSSRGAYGGYFFFFSTK
jgi:hypothetical protein